MTLPDFMIIGAMKCGTTTLQAQLAAQAGVFMCTPKEPNFFSDDPIFAKGMGWYQSLFADAGPGQITGEASTHYTKLPTYPETVARIAKAVPAARFVYMIRNPLDRVVSHYMHGWTQREINSDFATALSRHPELVEYGRYGMQITPFLSTFGADAVLLSSLEQLKADPQGELNRVGAFLGLGTDLPWQSGAEAENVSADRSRKLPLHGVLVDNPVAQKLRRTLVPKSLRHRVRALRRPKTRPNLSETDRQRLEEIFLQDRAVLALAFPDHPALELCYPFVRS